MSYILLVWWYIKSRFYEDVIAVFSQMSGFWHSLYTNAVLA